MSSKSVVVRYDECLNLAARHIFGDVVDKAYKATWSYDSPLKSVITRLSEVNIIYDDNEIKYGTNEILILFTSGKYVYFSSSEWASLTSIGLDDFEELV